MKLTPEQKRWLVSSIVTFLTAYFIAVGDQYLSNEIFDWSASAVMGINAVAIRSAFKVLMESALANKPKE